MAKLISINHQLRMETFDLSKSEYAFLKMVLRKMLSLRVVNGEGKPGLDSKSRKRKRRNKLPL